MDVKDNLRILRFFGLEDEDVPALRMVHQGNGKKYVPDTTDLTLESMKKFHQSYLDGTIQEFKMSTEVPDNWDSKPVKILVQKNFKDVALSSEKNVFVDFCK